MQRGILIWIILLATLSVDTLQAQQQWSLTQCVDYAVKNNLNVKKFELSEKTAAETYNQTKRDLLPSLGVSSNAGFSYGRSIDPNTNGIINTSFFNNSVNAGSSIVLFDGFRLQNRMKYEKYRTLSAQFNKQGAVDELAFNVMTAYFDVLYYKGMQAIAADQVKTSGLNLQAAERKVEEGIKAQSDLLEMRANLEMEELRRIQMENSLKTALLTLRQLMNLKEEINPDMIAEDIATMPGILPKAEDVYNKFIGISPIYQSVLMQQKVSERSLAINRSQLYPTINGNYSAGTGYYETNKDNTGKIIPYNNQMKNNLSQYLGASLNIPIFGRWANRSNVKLAKLALEQSKQDVEIQGQKLLFEISKTLNDIESRKKEFAQYQKQQEVDSLAYQTADKKLEQGLVSIIDYYVAKNRFANTESNVLRSRLQLGIQIKMLDFYQGKRFWE